jgi:hypothetical protein
MSQSLRITSGVGLILAGLLLAVAATAQKREPMTEVDVIQLLQGGVPPERVGTLARGSGIAFEITAGAERDLRHAGANDQLLETLRELQPGTQKAKKEAVKTDNPGAATGILLITVDAPCKLSVDGESGDVLAAGAPKRVSVAFGDHLIHAESTEDASVSVDWTGNVETPQQQLLQLRLAEKVAQATEARKAEEAEHARQESAQAFSDIMGKWTRTYTITQDETGYFYHYRNYTYVEEIELRPEGLHGTTLEGTYSSVLASCSHNTELCRSSLNQKDVSRLVLTRSGAGEYQGTHAAQSGVSEAIQIKLLSPISLEYATKSSKVVFARANP